jgi:hypothetical protein
MPLTPELSDGLVTSKIFPRPFPLLPLLPTYNLKTLAALDTLFPQNKIFTSRMDFHCHLRRKMVQNVSILLYTTLKLTCWRRAQRSCFEFESQRRNFVVFFSALQNVTIVTFLSFQIQFCIVIASSNKI